VTTSPSDAEVIGRSLGEPEAFGLTSSRRPVLRASAVGERDPFGMLFEVGRGLGGVLFLEALNERISSTFRATVISMPQLGLEATASGRSGRSR
jgi:hypothetical protein